VAEPRWNLDQGPRIELFAEQDAVDANAGVDFWVREDALPAQEASRRVEELHLVAVDDDGDVAGGTTTYLALKPQLRVAMWYYRAFIGAAHRRNVTGLRLALAGRDRLQEAFLAGGDTRGLGIVYEIENEGLKAWAEAIWMPTQFTFIGENELGDHVRVHWFPGALAPHGST